MTRKDLLNLIECYIAVEGYTDLRSILSVMSQEYPGEFDRKQAILAIPNNGNPIKQKNIHRVL